MTEKGGGSHRSGARVTPGALGASLVLLALVVLFGATTRWGRMYPAMVANTSKVWTQGHVLNAAERRLRFYDETYPVLLYVRENTPPDAVIMLPPTRFMKEEVAKRRPPEEDLSPILSLASSAYSFLYPRVTMNYGDEAPLRSAVDYLLVWDHWGLDLIDPGLPKTEENRVKLFSAPADPADRAAAESTKRLPRWTGKSLLDAPGPDRWVTGGLLLGLAVLFGLGDGLYRLLRRAGALPSADGFARFDPGSIAPAAPLREDLRERIGWRVLLALAAVPFIVILWDLLHVPITRGSFAAAAALLAAAGWVVDRGRFGRGTRSRGPASPAEPGEGDAPRRASWLHSPAAIVLSLGAGSLVLMSLIQIMILPERNYDALVGWDLVGKVMAYEGRLRSSVFTRIVYNAQAIYAPFCCSNNGFWYLFQPAINRLWVPLVTGGFLLVFHRRVQLWTGSPTAASLAAFLVLLPQAFVTQLTMSMTDLPSMVYCALAIFASVDLLRGRGGTAPAALLMLAAATCRTENVLLAGGAAAVVLTGTIVRGRSRGSRAAVITERSAAALAGRLRPLWIVVLAASFFAFWNLFYVKGQFGYDPTSHFRPFDLDFGRMVEVLRRALQIIATPRIFGEFWVMAALTPLVWCLGRWRVTAAWFGGRSGPGREAASASRAPAPGAAGDPTGQILLLLLVTFLCYLAFFYMWDPVLNPLWSMEHTFKRGFFRFMPGIVAAFFALPIVTRLARRCDA